jgi:excisionase family DNA binding protein
MNDREPIHIEDIPATRTRFTPDQAAKLLGVGASTVRRRIRMGDIDVIKVSDRKQWIPRSEIERLLTPQ